MKKNYVLLLLFSALFICSCHKANVTTPATITDVYLAGFENNGTHEVATYWKNGTPVTLSDGTNDVEPNSIFVSGNDVYVAGTEYLDITHSQGSVAMYWKNGIPVKLTDGSTLASAVAIAVSGTNVYVAVDYSKTYAGTAFAEYFKNGTAIDLKANVGASCIAVSGNDVYVGGGESVGDTTFATYWKNGVPVHITTSQFATLAGIAVSGNDIYTTGAETDGNGNLIGKYWKNRTPVLLNAGANQAEPFSIAISGNDVYVAGDEAETIYDKYATYWKNGNEMRITSDDLAGESGLTSMAISGNDIYLAGWGQSSPSSGSLFTAEPRYWKNAVAQTPVTFSFSPDDATFESIFVSTH